jgi:hypothetical protein
MQELFMNFAKFIILNPKDQITARETEIEMLINLDHIVSIKPIRIASPERLVNGFWIRTTNGKKYKAVKIPDNLLIAIGEKYATSINMNLDGDEAFPQ